MKKVLFATTALVMTAGFAAAEVSVGGDGRMGVIVSGSDDATTPNIDETDFRFTSRIRISFAASGETDAGLSFGGSVRADNAGGGAAGTGGNVFVEGTFGKLSMGDVDGGAKAAVGHVSGVGLTGLGDPNEIVYIANAGDDPSLLYTYSTGDITLYASHGNPADETSAGDEYAVGVSYSAGNYSFSLGYENADTNAALGTNADHIVVGVSAAFGDATVKAVYGDGEGDTTDIQQYALSVDYVTGATTVTAFYATQDLGGVDTDRYGLGVSYDLGGGAAIKAGFADSDGFADAAYDFGISMSF